MSRSMSIGNFQRLLLQLHNNPNPPKFISHFNCSRKLQQLAQGHSSNPWRFSCTTPNYQRRDYSGKPPGAEAIAPATLKVEPEFCEEVSESSRANVKAPKLQQPLVTCIKPLPLPQSSINNEPVDGEATEDPFPYYYPLHTPRPIKLLTTVDPSVLQKKALILSDLPKYYLSLSKARLSSLVVMTSLAGYCMGPGAFDPWVLAATGLGTFLVSAGANTVNQIVEVPYDSEMIRTKGRVLVRELLSTPHAVWFALTSSGLGLTILTFGANPLTAVLGATNLFLYTSVYTPLKRQSILNTWIGSVVGALPPLMGWAASEGSLGPGAYLLGGILFSWQFVHFNSLSWNLRADYKRAGYRMMSVSHPDLCVRTCLRYSVGLLGLCTLAPAFGLTHWFFAVDSLPFNCWAIWLAYDFYKKKDSGSSRKLFKFSLLHLPILILLMIISKSRSNEHEAEIEIGFMESFWKAFGNA